MWNEDFVPAECGAENKCVLNYYCAIKEKSALWTRNEFFFHFCFFIPYLHSLFPALHPWGPFQPGSQWLQASLIFKILFNCFAPF